MHAASTECPTDDVLLALVEGRLRGDALATVDSHLDGCPSCRELIATLASSPREAKREVTRADLVGRFVVLGAIGEGAMGVVYAAYDPELDRKVALKLLHADRSDARARARLVREAQAMARLSHPNVVTVYDVGTRGDEVYVAMELVEGTSLRAWLATPRAIDEVLELFARAGEGLAAAHDAGLVHRDFKPENVLVDAAGRPRVGDFGLAMAGAELAPDGAESALLGASITRTGALLGTPAYMAPEQLDGEPADARADQFAFCVALWEALTGRRPFDGARTVRELRAAIDAGPPPAKLPPHVRAALVRGLSARREDRHPDLRALLAALRRVDRPRRGWALVVVALVIGGALHAANGDATAPCEASRDALGATWNDAARAGLDAPTITALDAWARGWTRARVDACEATHVRHEQSEARLDRRMACLDRQRGSLDAVLARLRDPDAAIFALDAVETLPDPRACESGDALVPSDPVLRERVAAARRAVDEARVLLATGAHGDALARSQTLLTSAVALGHGPLEAEVRRLAADVLRVLARYDDAETMAEAAILVAETAHDDRGAAEGWLAAARLAGERGRHTDAARLIRHAEAAIARAGSPAELDDALHLARGVLRTDLGELEAAEGDLRAALARAVAQHGERSPRVAPIHTSLGNLLRVASRLDEALAAHQRALEIDRAALGDAHPRVGRDHHNVAGILRRLGRTDEALAQYTRALDVQRATLGAAHPSVALTLNSLGLIAHERGALGEARARWEEALVIFAAHRHGDEALVRVNLALLALDERRWSDAREHVERAIALDAERIGPRSKRTGSEHVMLARALIGEGRDEDARDAARIALSIAEEIGDAELRSEARALVVASAPTPSRRARPRPALATALPAPAAPPPPPAPPPPERAIEIRPPRVTGSGAYGAARAWE